MGAYAAASGTAFAISFMMSGLPTTRRRIMRSLAAALLPQDLAGVEADELHQSR